MDKTPQKVTKDKDTKRIDAGRKRKKNFIKKMKENILNDAKQGGGDTNNSINETTGVTNVTTTRSNDTYAYSIGILAVLAIGVCIFFVYKASQAKNKRQANEKQDRPPKRRHMHALDPI